MKEIEKTRTETYKVYVADDGTEFGLADDCIHYEKETLGREALNEIKRIVEGSRVCRISNWHMNEISFTDVLRLTESDLAQLEKPIRTLSRNKFTNFAGDRITYQVRGKDDSGMYFLGSEYGCGTKNYIVSFKSYTENNKKCMRWVSNAKAGDVRTEQVAQCGKLIDVAKV